MRGTATAGGVLRRVVRSVTWCVSTFALAMTLLPMFAHEFTHAAFSAHWSERMAILDPCDSSVEVAVDWQAGTPLTAVAVAAVAPTLVGIGTVVVVGALVVADVVVVHMPVTAAEWLSFLVAGVWWALYAAPNPTDVGVARDALSGDLVVGPDTDAALAD